MTAPQRVVAYVLRGEELLVFTEDNDPGVQVPVPLDRVDLVADFGEFLHRLT